MNYTTFKQKNNPDAAPVQGILFDLNKAEDDEKYVPSVMKLLNDPEAVKIAIEADHPTAIVVSDQKHEVLAQDVFLKAYEEVTCY